MNCSKCGEVIPDIAIFCAKCGARQEKHVDAETTRKIMPAQETYPKQGTQPSKLWRPGQEKKLSKLRPPEQDTQSNGLRHSEQEEKPSKLWHSEATDTYEPWNPDQEDTYKPWKPAQEEETHEPWKQAQANQSAQNKQDDNKEGYPEFDYTPYVLQANPTSNQPMNDETNSAGMFSSDTIPMIQTTKSNKPKIIALVICILVALGSLAAVIYLYVLPHKSNNIYTNYIEGIGKVLDSENFRVDYSFGGENVSVFIKFDPHNYNLEFLTETSEEGVERYGMYHGTVFRIDDEDNVYKVEDISELQEMFFRYYKHFDGISELSDVNYAKFYKELVNDAIKNKYPISYQTYPDSAFDNVNDELEELEKKFNDKEFLEDNFDYKKTESNGEVIYTIKINAEKFLKLIDEGFDAEKDLNFAGKLRSMLDTDYKYSITIKDGYLTKIISDVDTLDDSQDSDNTAIMTFSKFGSQEIDDKMNELSDYYSRMKKPYEESDSDK